MATRDISPGQVIATDTQRIAVANVKGKDSTPRCGNCFVSLSGGEAVPSGCCAEKYCSPTCRDTALRTYHASGGPVCRGKVPTIKARLQDLSAMYAPVKLLSRLASAVVSSPSSEHGGGHPLAHPLPSRWKPDFRTVRPIRTPFSLDAHIVKPISVLQALDVDVFADARWDTWVVLHLVNRIGVNWLEYQLARSDGLTETKKSKTKDGESLGSVHSLGFLLPLFNHACDPNLTTEDSSGGGGRAIKARRLIKEGDELTVNYVGLGLSKTERDAKLKCWFDSCRCVTCNPAE